MLPHLSAFLSLLVVVPLAVYAGDWAQWRGPSSNAISDETGLPIRWGEAEHIRWKASLAGLGVSSPIVSGEKVFVTSQVGTVPIAQGQQPLLARDDQALSRQENPIGSRQSKEGDSRGDVMLVVEAFRKSDGTRLWEYKMKATGQFPQLHEKHNLATPTPVTDGNLLYAWFGTGQIVALDMNGHLVWSRHLGREYSSFLTPWGHADPLVRSLRELLHSGIG
jgi:outer membrane protein assembly factor BamB